MKQVILTDICSETEHNVHFGTCELCMSTGSLTKHFFVFEVDGHTKKMENGFWDWGDYITYIDFVNAVNFINAFNKADIRVDSIEDLDTYWLQEVGFSIEEDTAVS